MFKKLLSAMAIGCLLCACDNGTAPPRSTPKSNSSSAVPVDYTRGRYMNAILGRGINLGNSWDSDGRDDAAWSNPIRDVDFAIIKAAGFNSVRIPVRWQYNSDYSTHTVDPDRLAGVIEDINLAIANGLAVVVNFHHYVELNCAGGGHKDRGCKYDATKFEEEKNHFLLLWAQVASVMNAFPDDMIVLEILNEPVIPNVDLVNQLMLDAYNVIRTHAPNKTIMFEALHGAKFYDIDKMKLPPDGNIIFSGHYYEPFQYSHQGNMHGNACRGDEVKSITASTDLSSYATLAKQYYPDINGTDHVPLNMGEFGVAGGDVSPCNWEDGNGPSSEGKAEWANAAAKAAISRGMSFHYWGFSYTGGFDAYDPGSEKWHTGFPQALIF
ncbi:glycoside hydrolase [Fibrobacter sp. UWB4]|uniref:glycoside hydrolase family 5 protein n=1 Tax=Fibrobacter sp. UWB4 TaxID=1964356 RepID=UPI000B51EBC3|nr:cellulase family glycosylhydrolase [Fibrobacter sp. UWB4]OWV15285.1 glycoside hydrolase [Fibrobacter sp. UWB4]